MDLTGNQGKIFVAFLRNDEENKTHNVLLNKRRGIQHAAGRKAKQ
jgi:hypothetical protein